MVQFLACLQAFPVSRYGFQHDFYKARDDVPLKVRDMYYGVLLTAVFGLLSLALELGFWPRSWNIWLDSQKKLAKAAEAASDDSTLAEGPSTAKDVMAPAPGNASTSSVDASTPTVRERVDESTPLSPNGANSDSAAERGGLSSKARISLAIHVVAIVLLVLAAYLASVRFWSGVAYTSRGR